MSQSLAGDGSAHLSYADLEWRVIRTAAGEFDAPPSPWPQHLRELGFHGQCTIADVVAGTEAEPDTPDGYDAADWWLVATTTCAAEAVLDFSGVSWPAQVFIDGSRVADATSMFLPIRCPLDSGTHEVAVRCGSLTAWLSRRRPRGRWRSTLVAEQRLRWSRTSLIGRAPVFGGVPPVIGLWQPAVLRTGPWIETLRVEADAESGVLRVDGRLAQPGSSHDAAVDPDAHLELRSPTEALVATAPLLFHDMDTCDNVTLHRFTGEARVVDPELWWPHGYGEPNLYRLTLRVSTTHLEREIGFRSIVADHSDHGFALSVNGQPVFCRGAVWVPPSPGHAATDDAIARQLAALRDVGATMVRVVGGLGYERPEFFSLCARYGLLVWQDAMLSTFDPPTELDPIVSAELAHMLDSVSGSPALAVVSGGSETLQQPEMLGVPAHSREIPLVDSLLRTVAKEHTDVPYVPSSPSSGTSADSADGGALAVRNDRGVAHWFGVGGYLRPLSDVQNAGVRFAAECLAFSIPPSDDVIEKYFGSTRVAGHDPRWKQGVPRDRTAAWDFEDVRDFYVTELFGVNPMQVRRVDPSRYLQLGRIAVAEAMAQCYAYWRRAPECAGALVLSARDLRPGAGWGLYDSDGRAKLPVAMLRRVWAPVALVLSDGGLAGLRIDLHNDTARQVSGNLSLVAVDPAGNRVINAHKRIDVPAAGSVSLVDADLVGSFTDLTNAYRFGAPAADAAEVEFVTDDGQVLRDVHVICPSAQPVVADISASLEATADPELWALTLTSRRTIRYVCIDAPGWTVSDQCFALAAASPYRVELVPDPTGTHAAPPVPRGRVTSADALDSATFAPATPSTHGAQ
ncbi:hypothetical protein [Gordonia aichiensis]